MKKTKMVCTIGPKSESKEMLTKLVNAGMNVMRLNFSHGDYEEHGARITTIREIMKETGKYVAVLLDTKGPEIRTIKLENSEDVILEAGQEFTITTDKTVVGNKNIVAVTYADFAKDLKAGDTILLDDGLIGLTVKETTDTEVKCVVNNTGELGENKGVNLPGVSVNLPALAEKDKADLKFGCEQGVDFVAASFIRKASDVKEVREILDANGGKNIKIISKIENQEGLDNFDEILELSDGIMVARGDLGVEIPVEEVPFAQKMMIEKCNEAGKIVITATQMLDSMIRNPRPTRAEAGDVANAILDGTDAVMLSGESAKGKYPELAVQTMAKICERTDKELEKFGPLYYEADTTLTEAVAKGAVEVAENLGAKAIFALTETGNTARNLRKSFPTAMIFAITTNEQTARQLMLTRGVYPFVVDSISSAEDFYKKGLEVAKKCDLLANGDIIVFTSGANTQEGTTNSIKIETLEK
ncbi:pyruvate kinase [Hypnocyclicus thermotrophus]|uniref:Pyruvate kinase n=1 Tax=Hypnocyclicus thermotrophus TaxID=1627895 RepID=A0AA46DYM0_9FUSO|nr:pyruvate kinase PykF [Hypnocyclicus thermotrophus]TDT70469.1 pyruvate kinase [Hypnocyclicus thermotrophus]